MKFRHLVLCKSISRSYVLLFAILLTLLPTAAACVHPMQVDLPADSHQKSAIYFVHPAPPPTLPIAVSAQTTPAPDSERFSIIWLADTQTIAYHQDSSVFDAIGKWIMAQKDALNIKYIVQTGDLVDNAFHHKEWICFENLSKYFFGKIPYLPIAGNHDLGIHWDNYRAYLDTPYIKAIPPKQCFKGGQAVYASFQVDDLNFLLVGEGWNAGIAADAWVSQVLRAHPNHIAILLLHSYINTKGELDCERTDQHDMLVKNNPNVRLVLSGHIRGTGYREEKFDDDGNGMMDRMVNAMLYNYQGYTRNNSGQIRILTFNVKARSIHVATYSPYTDRYYQDNHFKEKEFDLPNAF